MFLSEQSAKGLKNSFFTANITELPIVGECLIGVPKP